MEKVSRREFVKMGGEALFSLVLFNFMQETFSRKEFSLQETEYLEKNIATGERRTIKEYHINYGTPEKDDRDISTKEDYLHPVPEVAKQWGTDRCTDGWEKWTYDFLGNLSYSCIPINKMPWEVRYVVERLENSNELISIRKHREGDLKIYFHPDLQEDKKYHLEQLKKLSEIRI